MTAIRVIFDGKAFIPQQPVSLPEQSEALVFIDQSDPSAQVNLDSAVRAYYQNTTGDKTSDAADASWGRAIVPQSQQAWDED